MSNWLIYVTFVLFVVSPLRVLSINNIDCSKFGKGDFGRTGTLNATKGSFEVSWVVDLNNKTICFDLVGRTKGFLYFGLGRRTGPIDVVIGGVFESGTVYIEDRHSFGGNTDEDILLNSAIDCDDKPDWIAVGRSGWENETHTTVSVWRHLISNDTDGDININDDTLEAFWGFGEDDQIFYPDPETSEFGYESVNLLDKRPQQDNKDIKIWEVRRSTKITPGRTTSYWCSVIQGPELNTKHHAIRFDPYFKSPKDRQHIHHFVLYKCMTPLDLNTTTTAEEYFNPFVNSKGAECYESPINIIPIKYCREFKYVWAYGGKDLTLPDHVGIEMGNDQKEYYMLEVHYDNPDGLLDLEITGGITIHYTTRLRENEVGVLMLGYDLVPSLVIPPQSPDFEIYGHCSSNCTGKYIPSNGINLFGIFPHSHLLGRKISTMHFRNGIELPRITNDNNFDFKFQQTRILNKEVKIMPGIILFLCTYDNRERNGSTIGGLSTREEMCLGFMWYYPNIKMDACFSVFSMDGVKNFLGIREFAVGGSGIMQSIPIVAKPDMWANKTIIEVMDGMKWTIEKRKSIQVLYRDARQIANCWGSVGLLDSSTMVKFPPK